MPDLVDTVRTEIDARIEELRPPAREASDLERALDALSEVPVVPTSDGRARRRRSNRRVSSRARSRRGDTRTRVIEFVAANPGSTAGDVARALGLSRNSVATRLAQLAKSGELAKAWLGVGTERSRQIEREALHRLRELGGGRERAALAA